MNVFKGKNLDQTSEVDVYERFHYTDIHGLIGILESGTLRLCSYRTMNDSMELKWSIEHKLKALQSNSNTAFQHEFLNKIRDCLEVFPLHAYMTCFSSEKDLLSQWRAYGDDGKGVAIGFNLAETVFENKWPTYEPNVSDLYAGYFDVRYDNEEHFGIPMDAYVSIFNDYSGIVEKEPLRMESVANAMAHTLVHNSVAYKHPAFKEEKECRILNLTYQANNHAFVGTTSDIKFKASGSKLTSYFEYKFQKGIVTEIVLGPKSEIDINELGLFLQKYGYEDIVITNSSASYR